MSPDLSPLLAPLRLRGLELRNRVVMAPMTRQQSPDGVPTEAVAAYYARRATAGVGLIMSEGVTLDRPQSAPYAGVPNIWSDAAIQGWRSVTDAVHAAGAAMCCQLWHCGPLRAAADSPNPELETESPSGLDGAGAAVGRAASEEDLEEIAAAYARGARNAVAAGFDAVEVHCAHGYLLDTFLWEASNRRADRWGGRTALERTAFPLEVVRRVSAAVGPEVPVFARFSQWKQQDFSARLWRTPEDLRVSMDAFVAAGVDVIDCSLRRYWEPEFEGSTLSLAGWVRALTGVPTMAVGSVGLSDDFMSAFLRQGAGPEALDGLVARMTAGEFDLVAVGRALLADPEWFAKVRDGRLAELRAVPKDAIDVYF